MYTVSLRAGEEAGFGAILVGGTYQGRGRDATYDSLMGWGGDVNAAVGPVNVGAWSSFDKVNNKPSWLGISAGGGFGIGGSGGISYTWPIK